MPDLISAYGKAALSAAGLESNLLLLLALVKSQWQGDDYFTKEYQRIEKKTLGPLIDEAKGSNLFTPESYEKLDLILKYRNWMVHKLSRDMLGFIALNDGESILEQHLLELDKFFWNTSELIYERILQHAKAKGINIDMVDQLVQHALQANLDPRKYIKQSPVNP